MRFIILLSVALYIVVGIISANKHESPSIEKEKTIYSSSKFIEQYEIKDENIIENDWQLLLVNPWNELPFGFEVELENIGNSHKVDKRIVSSLNKMFNDARSAGISPIVCSSYRTQKKQENLYNAQIEKYIKIGYPTEEAKIQAAKWVAPPGTSEHQTGLALDIVDRNYQLLDNKQADTETQKLLTENAYKYGFILRYPENKTDITGINYEPWHYRYVGKDAAEKMFKNGMCLEEYLSIIAE